MSLVFWSVLLPFVKLLSLWAVPEGHVALQCSEVLRAHFMSDISVYDLEMIIWIDESGCAGRNCLRKFAYTLRPKYYSLPVRDTRYSAISAATIKGVHYVQLVEGSVHAGKVQEFTKNLILPNLQQFDANNVVVIDKIMFPSTMSRKFPSMFYRKEHYCITYRLTLRISTQLKKTYSAIIR